MENQVNLDSGQFDELLRVLFVLTNICNDVDIRNGFIRQREFRLTGSLGEIVFADAYELQRPLKSFGAEDGQDNGQDFLYNYNGTICSFDLKTMARNDNNLKMNYVHNIPIYQMLKEKSLTDYYFAINLHPKYPNYKYASFIGQVTKQSIIDGEIGKKFDENTTRLRSDGTQLTFTRSNCEVEYEHFMTPIITDKIRELLGFKICHIRPPSKFKNNESTR